MVPRDKYIKQPKLPSTYTREEVEALIASIERSSPKGKRDYTMVLIIARLGLRATDVCCLTFENIRWEQSLIVLNQQKTGERIELPLLSEIGWATIDYLKYGRPESDLPYIFLHANHPYDLLNRSTFTASSVSTSEGLVFFMKKSESTVLMRSAIAWRESCSLKKPQCQLSPKFLATGARKVPGTI